MSSGVFLTYFTIQHSIWLTTLTYGFMFGLGIALAYAPPMAVAMRWFPKQKGLVNGFIVGGFGMGAFMFNQIQTAYLNPKNLSLDDSGFFTNDEVKKGNLGSQQEHFIRTSVYFIKLKSSYIS